MFLALSCARQSFFFFFFPRKSSIGLLSLKISKQYLVSHMPLVWETHLSKFISANSLGFGISGFSNLIVRLAEDAPGTKPGGKKQETVGNLGGLR